MIESSRPPLLLATILLLAGCAGMTPSADEHADTTVASQADAPDPFDIVELANLRLQPRPEAVPVKIEPEPHLWQRMIDRFEFADCPDGSRAARWAQWFGDRPDYMERVLGRARPWLLDIADEIERRDLPGELALLPIVESGYDPFAYSHGRASGTWQFLSGTAREYGIEINDFYDGRRDVWAATRAALDYLEYLHGRFGDWNLALAAYNGGQGRVQRAINRNQARNRPTEWHQLTLPRETLAYVPKLNGLGCLFANAEQYAFNLPQWDDQALVARIELEESLDVVLLAAEAELDIAELIALNPGLNRHLTPPGGPHHVFVPAAREADVLEVLPTLETSDMLVWEEVTVRNGDTLSRIAQRHNTSVSALRKANSLNGDFLRTGQTLRLANSGAIPANSRHAELYEQMTSLQQQLLPTRRFQHQVRPGENLWVIARRYNVSISDVQRWNNLGNNNLIRPGQRLIINMDQPGAPIAQTTEYTVRSGDSLWVIARRHQVSVRNLMRWNGLKENSILRPGQKLVIRRETGA